MRYKMPRGYLEVGIVTHSLLLTPPPPSSMLIPMPNAVVVLLPGVKGTPEREGVGENKPPNKPNCKGDPPMFSAKFLKSDLGVCCSDSSAFRTGVNKASPPVVLLLLLDPRRLRLGDV